MLVKQMAVATYRDKLHEIRPDLTIGAIALCSCPDSWFECADVECTDGMPNPLPSKCERCWDAEYKGETYQGGGGTI